MGVKDRLGVSRFSWVETNSSSDNVSVLKTKQNNIISSKKQPLFFYGVVKASANNKHFKIDTHSIWRANK